MSSSILVYHFLQHAYIAFLVYLDERWKGERMENNSAGEKGKKMLGVNKPEFILSKSSSFRLCLSFTVIFTLIVRDLLQAKRFSYVPMLNSLPIEKRFGPLKSLLHLLKRYNICVPRILD